MRSIFILLFLFYACEAEKNQPKKELYYVNDFEGVLGWCPTDLVVRGNAHSGSCYTRTDSVNTYSYTFKRKISDISSKHLRKVSVSAWLLAKQQDFKVHMVLTVEDNGNLVFNRSIDARDVIKKVNQWTQLKDIFSLPANINPDMTLKVYLFNTSAVEVDGDDFELQFYN